MLPPVAAAAITCAALAAAWWSNRNVRGWLPDDPPRPGRKQHRRPIPLAGIVLVPAVMPWFWAEAAWWLLGGLGLAAIVGYLDDREKERGRDFDWRIKALGLGLAAAAGACAVVDPFDAPGTWLLVLAFVFVLTNATNFLDNTDGVAASLSAASLLVLSQGHGAAAAAGFAALGFLPWNWPRPILFLGDAGAYALGFVTGVTAATSARVDPSALWATAVQLGDFVQVVTARLALGHPPWVGDRRHLTHIVHNLGLPRVAIAPAFTALVLALALLA
ncbi:MAG: hypothetical protein ABIP94_15585 [Planctomycetota bacterium]